MIYTKSNERISGLGGANDINAALKKFCFHRAKSLLIFGNAGGIQITFLLRAGDFNRLVRYWPFLSELGVDKFRRPDEGEGESSVFGVGADDVRGNLVSFKIPILGGLILQGFFESEFFAKPYPKFVDPALGLSSTDNVGSTEL